MPAPRRVLVDTAGPVRLSVVEGKTGGPLVVEGKIGHCDVPTANGRVYPRSIMERELKRLKPRIEQASVYAAVDHPGDGKTRLKDSGAIVRDLWIEQGGEIHGKFEVVEEAPAGQAIAAFLRRGASVGMSSRGLGSTTSGANGYDVVGEDFRLNTWDFVSDPACHDAYPAIVSEDEEQKITEDHLRARFPKLVQAIEEKAYATAQAICEDVATDEIRGRVERQAEDAIKLGKDKIREDVKREVYEEIRAQLRDDFATKLVRSVAEMRDQITEEVKSDLSSDPEIAGAKLTLKKISEMLSPYKPAPDVQKMLSERDTASADLKKTIDTQELKLKEQGESIARLENAAKKLAYALYIEQSVANTPAAAEVKKLIGSLDEIKSSEELKVKVGAALAQAKKTEEKAVSRASVEVRQVREDADRRVKAAESQAKKESEQAQRLVDAVTSRIEAVEDSFKRLIAEKDAEVELAKKALAEREAEMREVLEQTEQVGLLAYAQKRTIGHKHAEDIVEAVSKGRLKTKESVNRAASRLEETAEEPGGVRERIRRAMSQGRETMTEDERKTADAAETEELVESGEAAAELREFGISLNEVTNLAGHTRPSRR